MSLKHCFLVDPNYFGPFCLLLCHLCILGGVQILGTTGRAFLPQSLWGCPMNELFWTAKKREGLVKVATTIGLAPQQELSFILGKRNNAAFPKG